MEGKMEILKIEINKQQSLEDVEFELQRLGLYFNCGCSDDKAKFVTFNFYYEGYNIYERDVDIDCELVTLEELKEMK